MKFKVPPKHPPTRHIKYKVIDFAPINKSIIAYISFLEPVWNNFQDRLSLAYARVCCALIVASWPKWAIFKQS